MAEVVTLAERQAEQRSRQLEVGREIVEKGGTPQPEGDWNVSFGRRCGGLFMKQGHKLSKRPKDVRLAHVGAQESRQDGGWGSLPHEQLQKPL